MVKSTAQLFSDYKVVPVKSRRSERGDLVEYFWQRINVERKKGGLKEFALSAVVSFETVAYFLSIYSDLFCG
jgi:hypothetical protein